MGKISSAGRIVRWSARAAELYAAAQAISAGARALQKISGRSGSVTATSPSKGVSKGRLVSGALGGAAVGRFAGPVGAVVGAAVGAAWAVRSGK